MHSQAFVIIPQFLWNKREQNDRGRGVQHMKTVFFFTRTYCKFQLLQINSEMRSIKKITEYKYFLIVFKEHS